MLCSEIPQTPPLTSVSARSLLPSIQEPQSSQSREPEPRRRSASRLSESWERIEFQRKAKAKERKGER